MNKNEFSHELKQYLKDVGDALDRSNAEQTVKAGIIRDLEAQISDMLSEEGMSPSDIIRRLYPPEAYMEGRSARAEVEIPRHAVSRWSYTLYILAVLSGAAAVTVESTIGISSSAFGDPFPSLAHFISVTLVPLVIAVNTVISLRGKEQSPVGIKALSVMNGYAAVVAAWYSIVFASVMTEVAAIAFSTFVFLSPLGLILLLPFSPLLSLFASVRQAFHAALPCREGKKARSWQWWGVGAMLAMLLLGGYTLRSYMINNAIEKALDRNSAKRESAVASIKLLRGEGILLEYCHMSVPTYPRGRGKLVMWLLAEYRYFDVSRCRALYYRLSGRDYREAGTPRRWGTPNWAGRFHRERERTSELGGTRVGMFDPGLSAKSAAIDISAARSGLAYAEYTLEFANSETRQKEARAQIVMPPGSVASRLSLWIDGTEREAAFGRVKTVRQAYEKVVSKARDPALLTADGPDRVLLQCFPVMPKETMKVKVGFTIPLIQDGEYQKLRLPYFAERNFAVNDDTRAVIWAESRASIVSAADGFTNETVYREEKYFASRGEWPLSNLASAEFTVESPPPGEVFSGTLMGTAAESAVRETEPLDGRLVAIVLDTSLQLAPLFAPRNGFDWEKALASLPGGARVAVFAGDTELPPADGITAAREWPGRLRSIKFMGADEQVPNIERAWDLCESEKNAVVLWIHGRLPAEIFDMSGMEQRVRRRPPKRGEPPRIMSLQLIPGANRLEERMPDMERLPDMFELDTADRLSKALSMAMYPKFADREIDFTLAISRDRPVSGDGDHIVRLAVARDIAEKIRTGAGEKELERASEDAVNFRLVTELSGAVVLET
ncbi:MAG: hypothetical protein LBS35_11385, partial [Synergistaceae bacterium]|nr:hypothetical protein [Synergistaceae bacterium]